MSQAEREVKHAQEIARKAVIEAAASKARYSTLQRLLAAVVVQAGGKIEIPKSVIMDRDRLKECIHVHNPETEDNWSISILAADQAPAQPITDPPKSAVPGQVDGQICTIHKLVGPPGVPCPECAMQQLRDGILCECGHAQLHSHVGGIGRCKRCDCQQFICAHTNRLVNQAEHTATCVGCDHIEHVPQTESENGKNQINQA